MTENEPFQVGDLIKNELHDYIAVVITLIGDPFLDRCIDLVISCPAELKAEADLRVELLSEIKKVPATIALIANAKKYLELKSSQNMVDNLLYIEILNNLNEQEKALKLSK